MFVSKKNLQQIEQENETLKTKLSELNAFTKDLAERVKVLEFKSEHPLGFEIVFEHLDKDNPCSLPIYRIKYVKYNKIDYIDLNRVYMYQVNDNGTIDEIDAHSPYYKVLNQYSFDTQRGVLVLLPKEQEKETKPKKESK